MKVVAVSDVHCHFDKVQTPEADVLICAGDMLSAGTIQELFKFQRWLDKQPAKHKIYVPGNHDRIVQLQFPIAKEGLPKDLIILIDEEITIDGIKFYGSPWVSPINGYWAYEFADYSGFQQERIWGRIPDDTDVLITHSPPQGIFSGPWGCEWLFDRVLQVKPQVHVFGHVHEEGGKSGQSNGTRFFNVSVCDEQYKAINPITEFELSAGK